jgi:LmbE family N-acetylglucosaminyl deacetylase
MRKRLLFFCAGLYAILSAHAQMPTIYNSADIYLQLKKLKVLGTVLYVAAHPDDENNSLLPFLAKEKLYRTAYLSLTRGEGGQNLIGSEQGVELGLIRTQELLAARRIDGAEQYFSRAYEFGYSKHAEEALRIWDSTRVLGDIVWTIRKLQPDIIITRFPGDARAGHGQHAASAILANQAFIAAADNTRFTEQFSIDPSLKPWKAKRILWNTYNFGSINTTATDQLQLEIGAYDPLLGVSAGELGGEARSMHKSQGEGRPRRKGKLYEYFAATGGEAPQHDLMDGVVTDWTRVNGGDRIQQKIDTIIANYRFTAPEASVPALVALYKEVSTLPMPGNEVWKRQKLGEIQSVLLHCAGIYVEATTQQGTALPGDTVAVNCLVNKRNNARVNLHSINVDYNVRDTILAQEMETNQNFNFSAAILPPNRRSLTVQPYWLVKPRTKDGMFEVTDEDEGMIGRAWNEPMLKAVFRLTIEGSAFFVFSPVQYKYTDPARGEIYQPFILAPHMELYLNPDVALLNVKNQHNKQLADSMVHIVYKPNFTGHAVPVTLYVMQDKVHAVTRDTLIDFVKDRRYVADIPVKQVYDPSKGKYIEAAIQVTIGNRKLTFSDFFKAIEYPHIPGIHYFFKDHVKFVTEEVKTVGKKIGYIPGSGDMVADALKQMGFDVQELNNADINDERLRQFDAIITGVRAYNLLDYLTNKYDVLMRYVQQGGNLIVQYNRITQTGANKMKIGPYPFNIVSTRVTEEDADVNFLQPLHPVLHYPNKINKNDFSDWVQERSTYQADQLDAHYEAPLGMHDKNEKESNGSLITAKYGKGNFAYVSLVLFRQLPAGVPGAYRLLANLIALPKNE